MSEPTEDPALEKLKSRRKRWMWASVYTGVGILIPPIIGLLGTVVGMIRAFHEISASPVGEGDPSMISSDISCALLATAIGLGVAGVFAVLFVISLIRWLVLCSEVANFGPRS